MDEFEKGNCSEEKNNMGHNADSKYLFFFQVKIIYMC
jgi:hypothetical protein